MAEPNREDQARQLAQAFLSGEIPLNRLIPALAQTTAAWSADASVDLDRASRCGLPEAIYGAGKSAEQILKIVQRLVDAGQAVLVTRIDPTAAETLSRSWPNGVYRPLARTWRLGSLPAPIANSASTPHHREVVVVTAGTTDLPVAEEALETLSWMGVAHKSIQDVGVAGPFRLLARSPELQQAACVVVVAGMEGALPSAVAGYVSVPVIAVPTSVGYGANLGGLAALLSMLNSCAAHVAVVNIDAGFKGGYLAGLIARG